MQHPARVALESAAIAALALASIACEGNVPVCSAGEMKVEGSIDEALLVYDRTCVETCWTFPFDEQCDVGCPPVDFAASYGVLVQDRRLMLSNVHDASNRAGYLYRFGFVDELGGAAPEGWGFLAQGPRSYVGDTLDASARFVVQMAATRVDPATGEQRFTSAYTSKPGRLEILDTTEPRIKGRFFVGLEGPTKQTGGELLGCFDLTVGAMVDNLYQVLIAQ